MNEVSAHDQASPAAQRSVGRSVVVMATGTVLSRLTGLLRVIAFARLGFGAFTDAYQRANNTPNLVYELILGGVLSATLVPVFVEVLRGARDDADRAISAVMSVAGVALIGLAVVLTVAAPWIAGLYYLGRDDPIQRALAGELLRYFGPQVAIYGFITLATAVLNARRRFGAPMFAPIINNLVVTAMLLVAQPMVHRLSRETGGDSLAAVKSDHTAKLLLGLGTTAGVVAMGLVLVPALRRCGIRFRWNWEPGHPVVRSIVALSGWTVGYVIANQVALGFVSWLSAGERGDYSAYNAAFATFFQLPHGVLAVSIMTALQPELSLAFGDGRRGRFRAHIARGIRLTNALLIPAAAGILVLSRPLTELVLRGGDMDLADVHATADALSGFAIGLPAFSCYLLLMNGFKAMRDTRTTFLVNVVENGINIGLAAVLYPVYGVRGLALAFALAYVLSALLAGEVLSRRVRGLYGRDIAASVIRVLAATAVMATVVWLVQRGLAAESAPSGTVSRPGSRAAIAVQVGAATAAGVTVYLGAARLLGVRELSFLTGGLRRRLLARRRRRPAARN